MRATATTIYHLQAGNRYYYLPPTSGQPLLLSTTYKRATATTTIYHLQAGHRCVSTGGQVLLTSGTSDYLQHKRTTADYYQLACPYLPCKLEVYIRM